MTLSDLFQAVNDAGIRLANVGRQLQLRGPSGRITPAIIDAAKAHKAEILTLLPPVADDDAKELAQERDAIQCEGSLTAEAGDEVLAAAVDGWDKIVRDDNSPGWQREWLEELDLLSARMRGCDDDDVLARLRELADASPGSLAEWLALGLRIRDTENELRKAGKLPVPHWPSQGEGPCHPPVAGPLKTSVADEPEPPLEPAPVDDDDKGGHSGGSACPWRSRSYYRPTAQQPDQTPTSRRPTGMKPRRLTSSPGTALGASAPAIASPA
jgi:hypothetical protein